MRFFKLFLLPFVVSCIFTGCAVNQTDIHGFNLISLDQERELGDKFATEIEKQQTVLADPELQRFVNKVGKRLLTGAREVNFDYTFKVIKDDSVNAFAIPGGHVYVQTGLLKAAQSESEIAAVMAHEINHAVARHGTRQMTQQYGYALLLQLVLGQNPNMLAQLASSLFGKAGSLAYSRGMESQADYLGVETMYKAGYNPEAMVTFFSKLESLSQKNPSALTKFFSSHPLTSERITSVKDEISKLPPRNYLPEDVADFRKMKARLQ